MFEQISSRVTSGAYDTQSVIDDGSHVRVARNAALSAVAIALLGAARLAFNVITGRRFGTETLGQVTLAINTAMFASLLVSGGWQVVAARYLAQEIGAGNPRRAAWIYRRTLMHNTAGGLVVAAGCAVVLALITPTTEQPGSNSLLFYSPPFWDSVTIAMAATVAFTYNAYQHLKASAYGFGRVTSYLKIESVASALLIAGVAIVAGVYTDRALLVPVVASYGVFCVAIARTLRRDAADPEPIGKADWRQIKGFSALAVVGTVASAGFLNLAPVFVGRYDHAGHLGEFSAALALVLPLYFLPRALSLALFPSIAFRFGQDRRDEVSRLLDRSARALAIVLLPLCAVAAAAPEAILQGVFGNDYAGGGRIFAILLGATYLSVVQIPFVTALSGSERRWYRVPVFASVIGFSIGIGLWFTLGAREGAEGVAYGYLIGSIPQAIIPVVFAARVFDVRIASVFARAALVWASVVAGNVANLQDGLSVAVVLAAFALLFGRDVAALGREVAGRLRGGSQANAD